MWDALTTHQCLSKGTALSHIIRDRVKDTLPSSVWEMVELGQEMVEHARILTRKRSTGMLKSFGFVARV